MKQFRQENMENIRRSTNPQIALGIFRIFKKLNDRFLQCTSTLLMPVYKIFFIFGHSLSLVVAIKFHSSISLPQYLLFPLLSITYVVMEAPIFTWMGQVESLSTEFLYSWRHQADKVWTREFQSLRHMQIRVGSIYCIQSFTYLIVLLAVSNLTINSLLIV
ncbi:unnamed protein product [Allacma fusca]|uniref:Uncharacterized protein n=1 Tax=Allacma fusca TaxID=39272 RepID=A0A8J2KRD7_9HEXA|nr:unnamed protein product [Allacma fusca]